MFFPIFVSVASTVPVPAPGNPVGGSDFLDTDELNPVTDMVKKVDLPMAIVGGAALGVAAGGTVAVTCNHEAQKQIKVLKNEVQALRADKFEVNKIAE